MAIVSSGLVAPVLDQKVFDLYRFQNLSQGLAFQLVPTDHVTLNTPVNVSFTIPLPLGAATHLRQIRITDAGNVEQPSTVSEVLRWRTYPGTTLPRDAYLRSVLVKMQVTFTTMDPISLKVAFNGRTMEANHVFDIATTWALMSNSTDMPLEYPANENIMEPIVIAQYPATWLCECVLRTRWKPIDGAGVRWAEIEGDAIVGSYSYNGGNDTYPGDAAPLPRIEQFAKTVVNDVRPHAVNNLIDYTTQYEPWLYDRAGFLWQMYIRTGKAYWFRRAHRATQFYINHIGLTGYFDLRADDLKYSYAQCMLIDMVMVGDQSIADDIIKVTQPGLAQNPDYTYVESIAQGPVPQWTERNMAYGMLACLNAWEATGDTQYTTKVQAYWDNLWAMQQTPTGPSWPAGTGLWHTIMSHEGGPGGGTGNDYGMSPWMGAILIDVVMMYYQYSGNANVLTWLSGLGDYYATNVAYTGTEGELTGLIFPHYFAGPTYNYSDGGQLADVEHVPDVLGAMAKCMWAKSILAQSNAALTTVFDNYRLTLPWLIPYWIRTQQVTIDAGQSMFRVAPPRKTGWWFNSSGDLTYLDEVVNG